MTKEYAATKTAWGTKTHLSYLGEREALCHTTTCATLRHGSLAEVIDLVTCKTCRKAVT